ncbi:COP9 signalosome complex subunit 7a [Coelomomyces lativittatus]|nr:COP9 signalosome complex subunit 7a [Coelomomyces lativittatus]KAJ1514134.1 COP9 signalosome complex subunit 7a [Coelomomyces lativittatus]KAJ1517227.1 COP9 signalosome complex subunit 7a [Coelomomyces lativittatus]
MVVVPPLKNLHVYLHQAQGFCQPEDADQLAELVRTVLSAPRLYHFVDLLTVPSVEKLSSTHPQVYKLLHLFSYGTLQEYQLAYSNAVVPLLSKEELHKLRLLTLIHLAATSTENLTYFELQEGLNLKEVRALEDLIMEGIYEKVIEGTLDQRQQFFHCTWSIGRDVHPDQLPKMAASLRTCANRIQSVLDHIEWSCQTVQRVAEQSRMTTEQRKKHLEYLLSRNKGKRPASNHEFTVA